MSLELNYIFIYYIFVYLYLEPLYRVQKDTLDLMAFILNIYFNILIMNIYIYLKYNNISGIIQELCFVSAIKTRYNFIKINSFAE